MSSPSRRLSAPYRVDGPARPPPSGTRKHGTWRKWRFLQVTCAACCHRAAFVGSLPACSGWTGDIRCVSSLQILVFQGFPETSLYKKARLCFPRVLKAETERFKGSSAPRRELAGSSAPTSAASSCPGCRITSAAARSHVPVPRTPFRPLSLFNSSRG